MSSKTRNKKHNSYTKPKINKNGRGFTLIELMIVIAVIAIILTLAIPTYQTYTIRAKVGEALSVSNAAKTSVASTCQQDRTIPALTVDLAGYAFQSTKYVANVEFDGPCTEPIIRLTTQNTGAETSPVLTITGNFISGGGRVTWTCVSSGLNIHVPATCRS